ncbi:MAG: amidohydrolase family protein [Myxococcota bacterium]
MDASIVDCHTHVVSPDLRRYPLDPRDLSGAWYREAPASAEDLLVAMDEHGVDRAILVQGVGAYGWKNDYAADAAVAAPARFASACAIDAQAKDAPETLTYWLDERGMRGLRLFALTRQGSSWLAEPETVPLFEIARARGAHVIVTLLPHQLEELERVLAREPSAPISLDHCAFALGEPAAKAALFALARFEGLHLKISTHNLDEAERGPGAAALVRELVDAFGAERLSWGSDFCQTHDRSYGALVALGRRAFETLPAAQAEACLSGTARRLWPETPRSR